MKGLDVFRWLVPAALAAFLSVSVQTVKAHGMGGGGGHMGGGGGHMGGGGGHMGGGGGHMAGGGTHGTSARHATSARMASRGHGFDRGRRFERGERFEREEREEHEFFARHNFFFAFDFAAFGFWPGWWDWDGWWYPPYDGYTPYDNDQTSGAQYGTDYWNTLAVSVQTKLANQGYYRGQVDGVIGSGSIEAIRRFQADHRLPVTGKIDPKLLKALGINYKMVAKA
jgi:Putative peptidoglycan binding domain